MPQGKPYEWKRRLEDQGYDGIWDAYFLNNGPDDPPPGPPSPSPGQPGPGPGPDDGPDDGPYEPYDGGGGPRPSFGLNYNVHDAPDFNAPKFDYKGRPIPIFDPQSKFSAPDPDSIYADPSFQFRMNQGSGALQASQAAKGLTRTGGSLKDILGYSQNLASQEYGNIYGRARDTYDVNYGQERDKYAARLGEYSLDFGGYGTQFDANYTGARDEYAPKFATWQTRTAANNRAKDLELANMWAYWFDQNLSPAEQLSALGEKG